MIMRSRQKLLKIENGFCDPPTYSSGLGHLQKLKGRAVGFDGCEVTRKCDVLLC